MTIVLVLVVLVAAAMAGLVWFGSATARKVERVVPPAGRFIDLDGTRLHYVDLGDGPVTVVLIHGLGGQLQHFTHSVAERLARDYRVITIDRPGSGYSTRPADAAAGPLAQAEVVAALIRHLELDRPVLVGHSLGGAIALAAAVAHPALVRGLALIAPLTQVPRDTPPIFQGLQIVSPLVRSLVARTLAVPLSIRRRDLVLGTVFGPEPIPADFATRGGAFLGARPSAFHSASTDLCAVPADMAHLVTRYGEIRMPVTVLFGTQDGVLDAQVHGAALATQVHHARVEYVEGAGHMLPLTVPDRVVAVVRSVVAEATAPIPSGG